MKITEDKIITESNSDDWKIIFWETPLGRTAGIENKKTGEKHFDANLYDIIKDKDFYLKEGLLSKS